MSMLSEPDFFWADIFKKLRKNADAEICRYKLLHNFGVNDENLNEDKLILDDDYAVAPAAGVNSEIYAYSDFTLLPLSLFISPLVEPQRSIADLVISCDAHERKVDLLGYESNCNQTSSAQQFSTSWEGPGPMLLRNLLELREFCPSSASKGLSDKIEMLKNHARDDKDPITTLARTEPSWQIQAYQGPIQSRFSLVSPQSFKLSDVPEKELRDRLGKGEIAPRDEYIPGSSEGQQSIDGTSYMERMNFGDRLRTEGKQAMNDKNYERALTLYTQGVHLLTYVKGTTSEQAYDMKELMRVFLRNKAIAALHLDNWSEAKAATTQALEIDEYDAKARFLRGRAKLLLGDSDGAQDDFNGIVCGNPFATDEQKLQAKGAIADLQRNIAKSKLVIAKMINAGIREESDNSRIQEGDVSSDDGIALNENEHIYERSNEKKPQKIQKEGEEDKSQEEQEKDLDIPFEIFCCIVKDLLSSYSSPEVQREINKARKLADYDDRRTLIRLKPILQPCSDRIFEEYGLIPRVDDPGYAKKMFDRHLWTYRRTRKSNLEFTNIVNTLLETVHFPDV